jgi:hypothetical protein
VTTIPAPLMPSRSRHGPPSLTATGYATCAATTA